jgi:intergrase/recombinase
VRGGRGLDWFRTQALQDVDWSKYREYLSKLYGKEYTSILYNYALRFNDCLDNPSKISSLPISIKSNVLKAMIALSKYLGKYEDFTKDFKSHGVKWSQPDSFNAFLNIVNNNYDNLKVWYRKALSVLADNEKLYLKFALLGLRRTESIKAFNQIIDLAKNGKLDEYYNRDLKILEHYKFKWSLRNTKNCFITIISEELITEISNSKPISYATLRKHLARNKLTIMIKLLRVYYATFLNKNGIQSETIDILQGRVSKSVFARHYLKESLSTLSSQILPLQLKMLESIQ